VSATTIDIPDHAAACKVHRISPFESWRVERTTMRKDGPDAKRFPATELVPGGYITSACSPLVYEADLFPKEYRGNVFVCEPANNLVHRDVLMPSGAAFIAKRADDESSCEFFASTDTWCRPVCLTLGPDGAIYVLDFYREVIETPLSLTEDMKRTLPLKSAGKGRIWRIVRDGKREAVRPNLAKASSDELIAGLEHPNYWWRITAQRLLVEQRQQLNVQKITLSAKEPYGRVQTLCALQGLQLLTPETLAKACKDSSPAVRRQAVRLAEPWLDKDAALRKLVMGLWDDADFEVRFQVALSAGEYGNLPATEGPLPWLMMKDSEDAWMRTAILSSCRPADPRGLLDFMGQRDQFRSNSKAGYLKLVTQLAALMTSQGNKEQSLDVLTVADVPAGPVSWQLAVLEGWGQGLKARGLPLDKVWEAEPKKLEAIRPVISEAIKKAGSGKLPLAERMEASRLLAYASFADAGPALRALLAPQSPVELQVAAVRALANHENAKVGLLLLEAWKSASPSLRRELLDALLGRADRASQLLDAIEGKQVLASQLEPAKALLLRKYPDPKIRARADKVLKDQNAPDRQQVIDRDESAKLEHKPEPTRGKLLFKKTCAVCHRLENEGVEVGPDLLSALGSKTAESLVVDILDPSREVDPRYIEYVVTLKDGRVVTGLITAETGTSLTLRRAEKAEDTLLRSQIDDIRGTAKSLMPEGLEMQLNPQELFDVIAYLLEVKGKK
jgi:putative heme-binding domain-containing protein